MTKPQTPTHRPDPFLEEVHRMKRASFARSGDDLARHLQRLKEIQERHKDRVVSPPKAPGATDANAA